MFEDITRLQDGKTGRSSSWDRSGRNADFWIIHPGESRVLADIKGPGKITHIWMAGTRLRQCLLKMTWDNAAHPSVICPLGDFFCLGHGIVNSHHSALFATSTRWPYQRDSGSALNCYTGVST
jgi:hypothetical protein